MNDLTEAQVEAYTQLNTAVENCMRAHDYPLDNFVLADFIVLGSMQKIEEDEVYTVYPILLKNGDLPWHVIHGLLYKHQLEVNKMSLTGDDNG